MLACVAAQMNALGSYLCLMHTSHPVRLMCVKWRGLHELADQRVRVSDLLGPNFTSKASMITFRDSGVLNGGSAFGEL